MTMLHWMTVDTLALLVEDITGSDPLRANRTRPVVDARCLLVNALIARGMKEREAAALSGFSRPTIHYHKQRLSDAMRYGTDPQLLDRWERLRILIDL